MSKRDNTFETCKELIDYIFREDNKKRKRTEKESDTCREASRTPQNSQEVSGDEEEEEEVEEEESEQEECEESDLEVEVGSDSEEEEGSDTE